MNKILCGLVAIVLIGSVADAGDNKVLDLAKLEKGQKGKMPQFMIYKVSNILDDGVWIAATSSITINKGMEFSTTYRFFIKSVKLAEYAKIARSKLKGFRNKLKGIILGMYITFEVIGTRKDGASLIDRPELVPLMK